MATATTPCAALAATPSNRGIFVSRRVEFVVSSTHKSLALQSAGYCSKYQWSIHKIAIKNGRFSYSGKTATPTRVRADVSGTFVNSQEAIGRVKVGRCPSRSFTAALYINPLRAVSGLSPGRIDMGVDYAGSGPLLALGKGRVVVASNQDSGPPSCWGISCWPGGGIVVYRLSGGPFAGKYVFLAENITVSVKAGQAVRAGERVAILNQGYPNLETGWAAGKSPETLAIADGHQCLCGDPGGWSSTEGQNFDNLLTLLGAPSGYLQPNPPAQTMPRGWPRLP